MTPDPAAFRLLVCVGLVFAALMAAGIAAWAIRVVRLMLIARRFRRDSENWQRNRALTRGMWDVAHRNVTGTGRLRPLWTPEEEERYRQGADDPLLGAGGLWSDDGSHHGDTENTENTEKE